MHIKTARPRVALSPDLVQSMKKVSAKLASFRVSEFVNRELFSPSVHLLNRKSKMMRPALVLMGAKAIGGSTSRFVDLAVAAELLHTSSLIHDDIIDGDRTRRGVESVHVKYGSPFAIISGDALIAKAVNMASGYGENVLRTLSKASMEICAGEALDYKYQKSGTVPGLDQYLNIASLKSASLIGACLSAAAVAETDKRTDDLWQSGRDLGLAFQIRDDILDFVEPIRKGTIRRLIPNIVTSIEKESRINNYTAVMKALQMNNEYINRAKIRLNRTEAGDMFAGYADLIKVTI